MQSSDVTVPASDNLLSGCYQYDSVGERNGQFCMPAAFNGLLKGEAGLAESRGTAIESPVG